MPALDLIRPSVAAIRVVASVNAEFARELRLPPYIHSLGLISAGSDNVTYITADEATKQAMVEVVYGRSLYTGAAHGPSSTAGEMLIALGGPNLAEVCAGLDVMVASIENGATFQWVNDAENTAFLTHVTLRTDSYLSSTAGITLGDPVAYLVTPPLEVIYGIDAALKSADVQLVICVPPPSETNYSAAFLTGSQAAYKVACSASTDAVLEITRSSVRRTQRRSPMTNVLGLLEVDGMVAAIDATDAMLKAANACLFSHEVLDPGRLTLVVEGNLVACHAVLDAGCAAAMCTGRAISHKEIGRPDGNIQWLTTGFNRQPKRPVKRPNAPVIIAESAGELLALLTSVRQEVMAGEAAAHFGWSLEEARNALEQLFSAETLRKRSSRCCLKSH